jgi:hypothetical protein
MAILSWIRGADAIAVTVCEVLFSHTNCGPWVLEVALIALSPRQKKIPKSSSLLGHVYTKGITPWLFNDHGAPLFGWEDRKVQSMVLWRLLALRVNPNGIVKKYLSIILIDMKMHHEGEKKESV